MAKARSSQSNVLVATDNRFPITVALADGITAQQFSPELLVTRKKELADLVAEAAKTFGFKSKTSLTDALDFSIGLISFALAHSTQGKWLPGPWTEHLISQSWKALVKESISLVRAVKEKDAAHDYLFDSEKDTYQLRDHLRAFALRRDNNRQWIGYSAFLEYKQARHRAQTTDALVRSLIKSLFKRPVSWKDSIDGPTGSEEALNTLLFRNLTGLSFAHKDIVLTEKDFKTVRSQYDDAPAAWLKGVQKRYELLQLSLPENLLEALDSDWVQTHFEKGPPKAKKWESDDIPGITGIYYYQVYL